MNVLPDLGGLVGAIFGGPVGAAIGEKAGEVVVDVTTPAALPAPPAKPLVQSKTVWFNLVASLGVAILTWAAGFDWSQIISPSGAVILVGAINIILRTVTSQPIGAPK